VAVDNSTDDVDQAARAANEALRRRDPGTAKPLFERVVISRPTDQDAWHGLALVCRTLGDEGGELRALDNLLAANPAHFPGLMMKADFFARAGDGRAAQSFYKAAVARAAQRSDLSPDLRAEVRRAEREAAQYSHSYETHLLGTLAEAGFDRKTSSARFGRCLDLLLGKSQIYLQSPTAFYFPELPHRQFYERSEFPWLASLEAATATIRDELMGVLAEGKTLLRPYIQSESSRPRFDYGNLADSSDWSAFYLIQTGQVVAEAASRCPRTMEALTSVPLTDAPERTPSVLFSVLRPHTHIPPHTGYTNARLICHLPLIVPGGCGLRVGSQTRSWAEGEALIFDDSIEHEAWNESDSLRAVLLFDIWRPELSREERHLVAATLSAVGSYAGRSAAWT
jgi:aspartyl/asparaginyl beta-hydroxylase (cupin superfamily)